MQMIRIGEANASTIIVNTCETQAKKSSHTLIKLYTIFTKWDIYKDIYKDFSFDFH